MNNNPVYIMLIGVPASGKSTFIRDYFDDASYGIFSSDAELEEIAMSEEPPLTYNEAFPKFINLATETAKYWQNYWLGMRRCIIDDHTNVSAKKRKDKLKEIPDEYTKIAFVFNTPERDEWRRRLQNRPGKIIPSNVLEYMASNFTNPSYDDGFDFICHIQ